VFKLGYRSIAPVSALIFSAALLPLHAQSTTTTASGVSITVTSSANPSVFAAPVTFTVVVAAPTTTGATPTGTTPTGTVNANLGPTLIGAATLDLSGKATIMVPETPGPLMTFPWGLPAGADVITFSYSGDKNYKAAQSNFTQFVKKAETATTAAVNGSSQPVQLTATVSINEPSASTNAFSVPGNLSSAPTGTVQFVDGNPLAPAIRLLGTATLTPSGLFTSTATLTVETVPANLVAIYLGDDNYDGSSSPPVTGTGKGTVSLMVTASDSQPTFAEPLIFTVQVTPSATGAVPTGAVDASFLGLFVLGTATLDGTGKGAITVPSSASPAIPWGLPAGSDSITFSYSGDTNYSSAQTNFTETVAKAATETAATVSPSAASITATVSIDEKSVSTRTFALPGPNAAVPNPSGMVQFLNGTTPIGTAPMVPNGLFQSAAKLTVTQPFSSSAVLTAVYNGDSNYTGSTSPPATMPTLAAVTISVQSSANPSTFAEPVTLTITVAPASGSAIPTGTVQASVLGSDVLGGATLDSTGSATITIPPQIPSASPVLWWGLATGTNDITVAYSGDNTFAPGQADWKQTVNQAATTTKLLFAPSPSNEAVVVAAVSIDESSVSDTDFRIPAPGGLSTSPTGVVNFYDGTTLLGTGKLSPSGTLFQSTVTFSSSTVPSEAVYAGDTNYTGSSSPSTGNGNGTVAVTLQSSASPNLYGAALTIVANVTATTSGGPTPTGTVQFFDGSQNLGWVAALDSSGNGTLKFPIPLLTPLVCVVVCPPPADALVLGGGSHSITAQYSGDANYASATSATALAEQITKAPTNTSVSAFQAQMGIISTGGIIATVADAQPPSGGPYHFQAMTPTGMVEGDPTGTVTFYNGTTSIGTGTLTPSFSGNVTSTASLSINGITSTGALSASYPGDANFQASSSPTLPSTSVSLSGNPNPSNTDQSVTLTATITTPSATPAPSGTVSFFDGKTPLGNAPVSGGTATLTTTFTTAGSHSLTAIYSGDANYQGSTSPAYTQTVNSTTTPTDSLKLTVSTTTAVYGQHVVLFVQVIGNVTTPPTGTVNFLDGSTNIGAASLTLGTAYVVVTLAVGTHQISATWAGDSNWPAGQSSVVTLTVNPASTIVRLTSFGTAWTAVVMPTPPGEGTPTGSVQFVDTVTQAVLATGTLNNGSVTVTLTSVTDPVQAVYSGDSNFNPSKSRADSIQPSRPRR